MVYGEDVTHIVTEEGIAYLYKADGMAERRAAVRAVAGVTEVGLKSDRKQAAELRSKGIIAYPEDIGVRRSDATRSLLSARSMKDLVTWSGGLYKPPIRFRNW
jgi:malonate decarboxylase alpha subunit